VSVGFVSLGCAKNLVDSQIMAGVLLTEDVTLAPSPEEADVVIVNTCAFIEEAREESIDAILSACCLKEDQGPCRAVIVTGCLPQRYKSELHESLSEVDAFIGLDELEKIAAIVKRVARGEHAIMEISNAAKKLFEPRLPEVVLTGGPYAYLRVAEGCNHGCTFCAIPMIRGAYRSRPIAHIVKEAEQLLATGIKELDLISQDTTLYGRDLKDGTNLADLLRALGRIGGGFWIRVLYGYPSNVTEELLDVMGEITQVCRYLDVPVQHSDPGLLKAMGRSKTMEHVYGLAERVRRVMPDAVLRTTCLVGFPGETEAQFERLLDFARDVRFDHLGVFAYSPEEHTKASEMPRRPSRGVAESRRERLLSVQKEIVESKNADLVGARAEVLLETQPSEKDDVCVGRSRRQAPEVDGETFVSGTLPTDTAGTFVEVRFTSAAGYGMKAARLAAADSAMRRKESS